MPDCSRNNIYHHHNYLSLLQFSTFYIITKFRKIIFKKLKKKWKKQFFQLVFIEIRFLSCFTLVWMFWTLFKNFYHLYFLKKLKVILLNCTTSFYICSILLQIVSICEKNLEKQIMTSVMLDGEKGFLENPNFGSYFEF